MPTPEKIQQKIIRAQGVSYSSNSEQEILRAALPLRFPAFQASNPLNSEAAASQGKGKKRRRRKKAKLTTNSIKENIQTCLNSKHIVIGAGNESLAQLLLPLILGFHPQQQLVQHCLGLIFTQTELTLIFSSSGSCWLPEKLPGLVPSWKSGLLYLSNQEHSDWTTLHKAQLSKSASQDILPFSFLITTCNRWVVFLA